MDTREKILTTTQALEAARGLRASGTRITLISGYFDVLQPSLVKRVQEVAGSLTVAARKAGRLFALVLDPPAPLLPARARTELAAALRVIDYVIYSSSERASETAAFIASLAPDQQIRAEEDHLSTREQLIQHVLERHGQAAGRQSH